MRKRASVGGAFGSLVCNFLLALGVLFWLAYLIEDSCSACAAPQRELIGIAAATCVVFARPALSRSLQGLEPALDVMFIGRLMGLALGVMAHLRLGSLFG
ncbi:hypothetical protein NOV72_02666 [Caballeronia novacaledonica]|uniref:Uncharacterized protein n=1 Tax=Caballeronia novacaledonica TaxID=1544861 RepID=A0A2U3I5L2_9BURK|nr:hypothetical protein NOV72_02666 [Caballeronia novacaledonica]